MKGLSSSRGHHHVVTYEPSYDPLGHQHVDRKPYLISQMDIPVPVPMPHPAELSYYNAQRSPYPSDSNVIVPYGTFPRRCHSTSSSHHPEVPQDDWGGFSPLGKEEDIPCRRMRSGSYVKAMAEDDSGDSDGSPKPSPKVQARRASYLKATQPSLTEMTTLQISTEHSPKLQIRSHSYLRAVSEVSINRSLDTLDPKTLLDPKSLLSSPQYRSRNESYMRAMSTISQTRVVDPFRREEHLRFCSSNFMLEHVEVFWMLTGCFHMISSISTTESDLHPAHPAHPAFPMPCSLLSTMERIADAATRVIRCLLTSHVTILSLVAHLKVAADMSELNVFEL
ncbi:hypothetical protein LDENG_00125120 [Lucifuga dentata]|nr:hypothetical protein LDENG_00125120 [Lucifuga dentata]